MYYVLKISYQGKSLHSISIMLMPGAKAMITSAKMKSFIGEGQHAKLFYTMNS